MAAPTSGGQSLELKRFDPDGAGDDKVILLIARRNSGKSQMIADLLYHYRNRVEYGIVMSATEEATGFFNKVCGVPDTFIYGEWNPDTIERLMAKQMNLVKQGTPRNCFLVLDDMAYDKSVFMSKQMREVVCNGRHMRIFTILTAQFINDVPTYMRANADYVIAFRHAGVQDRERLWKNFYGIIPTFSMFCAVMDKTTENYECLVLDNTTQSNRLTDCIFWYKAQLRLPESPQQCFKIGCPAYHAFHARRNRTELAKRNGATAADPPPLLLPSRKPRVVVRKLR